MIDLVQRELIKDVIEKGYDLEVISTELKLPLEEIQMIKKELDEEIAQKENMRSRMVSSPSTLSKMEKMRSKYYQLYYKNTTPIKDKKEEISQEEKDFIKSIIDSIEALIDELKNVSISEANSIIYKINENLICIENLMPPINDAERLMKILVSENLEKINFIEKKLLIYKFEIHRKKILQNFVTIISKEASYTTDLNRLISLKKKFSSELESLNTIIVAPVKMNIDQKINKIRVDNALQMRNNQLSPEMSELVSDIVSRKIDVEEARQIIDNEKLENSSIKIPLTTNSKRESAFTKIKRAIQHDFDKYPITDVKSSIENIMNLTGTDFVSALNCVLNNFTGRKKYSDAKNICNQFSDVSNLSIANKIESLKRKVIISEIGDIILKGIKMKGTPEEEQAYIDLIENGLNQAKIDPQNIILGKTEDNQRDIKLSEILNERVK